MYFLSAPAAPRESSSVKNNKQQLLLIDNKMNTPATSFEKKVDHQQKQHLTVAPLVVAETTATKQDQLFSNRVASKQQEEKLFGKTSRLQKPSRCIQLMVVILALGAIIFSSVVFDGVECQEQLSIESRQQKDNDDLNDAIKYLEKLDKYFSQMARPR